MSDATILTETPPLRAMYAPIGEQARVPITGNHTKRVVFGALNIHTGHAVFLITTHWDALCFQAFLRLVRSTWRGWHIVLFLDRGSPHKAHDTQLLAEELGIQIRWLPPATPELNALEGLCRNGKNQILANQTTKTIDDSADQFCHYLLALSPTERLNMAGVLSGTFWLKN